MALANSQGQPPYSRWNRPPAGYCSSTCKNPSHACKSCGTTFAPKWSFGPHAYCSNACKDKGNNRKITKPCLRCGREMTNCKSLVSKRLFCSRACGNNSDRRSPKFGRRSAAEVLRADKVYGKSCLVCGFDRLIEYAHILPASQGGTVHPGNILPLCPNHHSLFDGGLLTLMEMRTLSGRLVSR